MQFVLGIPYFLASPSPPPQSFELALMPDIIFSLMLLLAQKSRSYLVERELAVVSSTPNKRKAPAEMTTMWSANPNPCILSSHNYIRNGARAMSLIISVVLLVIDQHNNRQRRRVRLANGACHAVKS